MTKILDIALADGRFYTLYDAIKASSFAEDFTGEGYFTIFAPTDDAFQTLPEGTLAGILQDQSLLGRILAYHVLPLKFMAGELALQARVNTLHGGILAVKMDGDNLWVQDARVIMRDIEGDNGVIHVIDKLLIPS
jgi:transforming growth factor-beta-induced protein